MNATMFMLKACFPQHVIKGNVVQSQYFCQAPVNGKMDSTQRSERKASRVRNHEKKRENFSKGGRL